MSGLWYLAGAAVILGAAAFLVIFLAMCFRIVVPTNSVDIVQSAKETISYGKDQPAGNTYYRWPSWVPVVGVKTISLPVSVFDQTLTNYAAYDKGRVPFVIDVMAFFRIVDSNLAAQRVHSFEDLMEQLKSILQGAIRSILASSEIEEILEGRAKFGELFTAAVDHQLAAWGVQNVKNIELMDIRDAEGSQVIANIMAKKKSFIEMQSRVEVANNKRQAQTAEIENLREVELRKQEAEQQVGQRTAEKEQRVGVAKEVAQQQIKEQAAETARKTMAVARVEHVVSAEIAKDVQIVQAEQEKATVVIKAEGHKQQTITIADGDLQATQLRSTGITVEGIAKGEAEKAILLAPVQAQITLAKEIGENNNYQTYLVSVRQIEANQAVGIEQAKALTNADVKVIANTGSAVDGVSSAMQLFTPKGGLQFGAALEALKSTPAGEAIINGIAGLTNGHRNGSKEAPR